MTPSLSRDIPLPGSNHRSAKSPLVFDQFIVAGKLVGLRYCRASVAAKPSTRIVSWTPRCLRPDRRGSSQPSTANPILIDADGLRRRGGNRFALLDTASAAP
ncbi:hypothetical protein M408DRAFT_327766 [Serendipita vermifera MAFF 305830]|uniref:Uncharacterized protein n=1 Tax=Serendipita vermifera MAFF 305830 TaxID=933852 RepID=A0A0C3B1R5_SERVB|nr:hypothetical protein M408DRAFT_327766 [Serendipita vermifera MAFF 305830]